MGLQSLIGFSFQPAIQADTYTMGVPVTQFARYEDRLPIDVFVVSPNPKIRQLLQDKLGLPRWKVSEAGSGSRALELLDNNGADDGVLLLDPMLPDLEASEFHGIVKLRFPNTQILTLNSHTGQLLIGSSSPTPLSTQLVELVNRGGAVQTASIPQADRMSLHKRSESKANLRGMI